MLEQNVISSGFHLGFTGELETHKLHQNFLFCENSNVRWKFVVIHYFTTTNFDYNISEISEGILRHHY